MSRRPYGSCYLNAFSSAGLQTKRIYEFQRKDQDLCEIIDYLESDILPSDNGRAKRLLLSEVVYFLDENSILYHLDTSRRKGHKDRNAQLVLLHPLRYEVLVHVHDDLSGDM